MSKPEIIKSGKYEFQIIPNIQNYENRVFIHTYTIGGDYDDCINMSYTYKNSTPIKANISHLSYEPECSIGSSLEKGSGTEIMIKAIIRYAYNEVPSVSKFEFDDNSRIDCVEKDKSKSPPRKPTKPLNLAFFYIAYHDKTWYEARFNAKMMDPTKYRKYKESLSFLKDPAKKLPFADFLQIIGGALDSTENIKDMEKYYSKASTYREFFENIPKKKRCDLLYGWLDTFMKHYIPFDDKAWFINVNDMDKPESIQTGGSLSRGRKYRILSYKKMSNF